MLRTSFQPLAHLVDAAALKWLAVENASEPERRVVRSEISQAFHIGDHPELTFHGLRYLLKIIRRDGERSAETQEFLIEVHEIALHE